MNTIEKEHETTECLMVNAELVKRYNSPRDTRPQFELYYVFHSSDDSEEEA